MIISHKFQFIFLKTAKTAGTSVEIALSRYCGDQDVITPILPECESIRARLGYRGPQNYLAPLRPHRVRELARWIRKGKRPLRFYNHMPAAEVRRLVGEGTWKKYFKFCVERNPWDRLISLYYWNCRCEPRPSFSDFIDSGYGHDLSRRGYDLYTIDGEVAVDHICRFESLAEDLASVCSRLGLPGDLVLPRAKAAHRVDRRCYREVLGETERRKIESYCAREIELLGYRF